MDRQEEKLKALSSLIISVFRLNGRIIEWGDLLGAPEGLSSARWQILGAIRLAGTPLTAPQISHAMGVSRQAVQKQLDVLRSEGLVRRLPNPRNGRSWLYALTAEGGAKVQAVRSSYGDWLEETVGGATAADLQALQKELDALSSRIEGFVVTRNGKKMLLPRTGEDRSGEEA